MTVIPQRFSLFKRPNGVYYILYSQNGRQRWKSTNCVTKTEALRAVTDFKQLFEVRLHSVSFEQFVTQFQSYAELNLSHNSFRLYKTIFKTFSAFLRGECLNEITPELIDRYKTKRLKEISPVSVNAELRMLKASFSTAKRWRMIAENPFNDVSYVRVPEQAPLCLSPEDFQKLISCIHEGWFRDIVVFAVVTGMRRGEIFNLRWCDVELERKAVNIQTNATWKTKHGKRRMVPLNETAAIILDSKIGKSPCEYVFSLNDKKISESWATHLFKRYVRISNLSNQKVRFHSLRHTFATNLLRAGVPIYEVQKLLGHSSVKVTEVYSHLAASELYNAVNRITVPLN